MGVRDALLFNTTGSNFEALQTNDTARIKGDLSLQKDDGTEVLGIDVSTATLNLSGGITGSGNISSSLSSTGSFGRVVGTTFHGDGSALKNTLPRSVGIVTQSAQLAADISGAFSAGFEMSASISGSATSTGSFGRLEGEFFFGDGSGIKTTIPRTTGILTSSAQIAADISGSFNKGFSFSGTISGSATTTGSFGRLEATTLHGDATHIADSLPYPTGIVSSSAQLASDISGSFNKGFEFTGNICAAPSAWLLGPDMVNGRHRMGGKGTYNAAIAVAGGALNAPDHSEAGYVTHPSYFVRVCNTEEFNGISWSEVNDINFGGPRGYGGTTEDGAALGAEHPESNNTEHWNGTNWSEGPAIDISPNPTYTNHRNGSGGGCTPTKLYAIGGSNGTALTCYDKDAGTFSQATAIPYPTIGWLGSGPHTGESDALLLWGSGYHNAAAGPTALTATYDGTGWTVVADSLMPDHTSPTGAGLEPGGGGRVFPHPYAHITSHGAGKNSAGAGTVNDAYSYGGEGAYGESMGQMYGNVAVSKHYNWDGSSWSYQGIIPMKGTGWTPGTKPPSVDVHGEVGPAVTYPGAFGHHVATGVGAGAADAFVFGGYYQMSPSTYPTVPYLHGILSSGSFYHPEKAATLDVNLLSFISGSGDASSLHGALYPNVLSGSQTIAADISGSFNKGFGFSGEISGSVTSTGSFGRIEADFLHGDGSSIAASLPRSTGIISGAAQIAADISGSFTKGFGYSGTIKASPVAAWSTGGNLNTGRNNHNSCTGAGVSPANAVSLFGGSVPGSPYALTGKTENYDGTSWTESGDLNDGRRDGAGFGTQTAGVYTGGFSNVPTPHPGCRHTEEFDGTSWTEVTDFPHNAGYIAAAGTQNAGLVAFGGTAPVNGAANIGSPYSVEYNGTNWVNATTDTDFTPHTAQARHAMAGTQDAAITVGDGHKAPGGGPYMDNTVMNYDGTSWSVGVSTPGNVKWSSLAGTQNSVLSAGGYAMPHYAYNQVGDYTQRFDGTSWSQLGNMVTRQLAAGGAGLTGYEMTLFGNFTCTPPTSTPYANTTQEYFEGFAGSSFHRVKAGQLIGDGSPFSASLQSQLLTSAEPIADDISGSFNKGFTGTGDIGTAIGGVWSDSGGAAFPGGRSDLNAIIGIQKCFLQAGPAPGAGTEAYEFNGSNWSSINDINTGRQSAGGEGTVAGAVLFGGYSFAAPAGRKTETEIYNGTNWSEVNDMIIAQDRLRSAGASSNAALSFGGTDGTSGTANVGKTEEWNGTNWTARNDMVNPASDSYYHNGGGSGESSEAAIAAGNQPYGTAVEIWNGTNWSVVASLSLARRCNILSGTTNDAITFGGRNPSTNTSTVTEAWNGTSWSTTSNMISYRNDAGSGTGGNVGASQGVATFGDFSNTNTEFYDGNVSSGSFGKLKSNTGGEIRTNMFNLSGSTMKLPLLSDYQINFQDYQPEEGTGSYSGSVFRGTSIRSADVDVLNRPGNFFFHSDYNALGFTYLSSSIYSQSIDAVTCTHVSAAVEITSSGFISQSHYCYHNVIQYITASYT